MTPESTQTVICHTQPEWSIKGSCGRTGARQRAHPLSQNDPTPPHTLGSTTQPISAYLEPSKARVKNKSTTEITDTHCQANTALCVVTIRLFLVFPSELKVVAAVCQNINMKGYYKGLLSCIFTDKMPARKGLLMATPRYLYPGHSTSLMRTHLWPSWPPQGSQTR